MPNSIQLRANVPIQLTLLSPEGELDGGMVHFETTGGTLSVSRRTAAKIEALELRPNEQFFICKYQRDGGVEFNVGLDINCERQRAVEEAEDPESLMPLLDRSIRRAERPERFEVVPPARTPRRPIARAEMPHVETRGTGTTGPAPQPAKATAPPKIAFQPIPYNIAFREVTQFVTAELKSMNEQWADQAKQDLISTILISAQKQGLLKVWEREG